MNETPDPLEHRMPKTIEEPSRTLEERELFYADWDALLTDIRALEVSHEAGTLRATGTWTPGQVLWHVGRFIRFSIEGFPFRPPLPIRVIGRLMRPMALSKKPLPRGIRLNRPGLDALIPPADCSFEDGAEELRSVIQRLQSGDETCSQPSPLFGKFTNAEWAKIHFKHAKHHMSLLHP